jgi:hypothetical protein
LPNGNTLICEGIKGNLFEVTSAGLTVWRYLCPVTDAGPMTQGASIPVDPARSDQFMNAVFRVDRYATNYPGLVGRDLPPQGTIELGTSAPVNTPPVAGAVALTRTPYGGVKISIPSLLSHVVDAEGDPITLVSVSAVSAHGGSVVMDTNWRVYTPAAGFTNADLFTYAVSDGVNTPVTSTVTVNVLEDNSAAPYLAIMNLANGACLIYGNGIPGRTYRIEYVNDLNHLNWQLLGTATANQTGILVYLDSAGSPQRFYRSVYPAY